MLSACWRPSASFEFPIYATPLAFTITGICTFFAISKYKIINLQPVATQMILDNISDSYFVINIDGVLLSENERFTTNLKQVYGIRERVNLDGYLSEMGDKNVALLYNLINAVQSSKDSKTVITYEQDVIVEKENEAKSYTTLLKSIRCSARKTCWAMSSFLRTSHLSKKHAATARKPNPYDGAGTARIHWSNGRWSCA